MKKLFIVLAMLAAINTNAQWVVQTISTSVTLYNLHFLNSNTGYIAGSTGTILKTTNGGTNWVIQTTPTTLDVNNIYFIDSNTGFASCGDNQPSYAGAILKTTNGGINWITKYTTNRVCFRQGIQFFNSNTGFVGGWAYNDSAFFKTSNGGENWECTNFAGITGIDNFFFLDAITGWGVGYNSAGRCVIRSTNGGVNWVPKFWTTGDKHFKSLHFVDANTGWLVGMSYTNESLIKKTTAGGTYWVDQTHNHPANLELFDIYMTNANTGWIVGDIGQILKTTNGGTNWNAQVNPTPGFLLYAIEFIGADTGWIVGGTGKLYKTVNGGELLSVQNISTEVPTGYSLSLNYPNPFNPTTKIRFSIVNGFPIKTFGNDKVVLKVYDVMGREVQTLVNERLQSGTYEATFYGSALNSGVYFYKLIADGFTETKKMLMIK